MTATAKGGAAAIVAAGRRVGRPSVATERKAAIVEAFIVAVGEGGLEAVTLDEVASRAGVQRPALRHFVGNRAALVDAALTELTTRYRDVVAGLCGEQPALDPLLDALFSRQWSLGMRAENRAFDALCREALVQEGTRGRVRETYDVLLHELSAALGREYPQARATDVGDVAYAIACLSEHNVFMQQVGYPEGRAAGARRAAGATAATLAAGRG